MTSSFDKFTFNDDDPFNNVQPLPPKKNITNGNSTKNNNEFDAFGLSKTTTQDPFGLSNDSFGFNNNFTKPVKETAAFGFEADFANFDAFNGNSSSNMTTTSKNGTFDAWGDSQDKSNNNFSSATTGKIKNPKDAEIKKIRKFSADYSENFDQDINEVLKRSMVDQ